MKRVRFRKSMTGRGKSGGMINRLPPDVINEVRTFNDPRDNQSLTTTSKNQYRITNEADIVRELYDVGEEIDNWFSLNRSTNPTKSERMRRFNELRRYENIRNKVNRAGMIEVAKSIISNY